MSSKLKKEKPVSKVRQPAGSRANRPKLKVSIIGAGRVGAAFGLALRRAGYSIEVVVAKHSSSAQRVARLIGGGAAGVSASDLLRPASNQLSKLANSSLLLIAIPDDDIAMTANNLANVLASTVTRPRDDSKRKGRTVLHTSGALSSQVLAPLRRLGYATGSLHPLVSVSDSVAGAELFTGAFFSIEGNASAKRLARSIVRDLKGQAFTVKESTKALYHAGALMASPNMIALFDIALEILGRVGLSRRRARLVLVPLVASTLANLATQDPAAALTGTFKRGDSATVRRHLAALRAMGLDDALDAYLLLGQRSLALAASRSKTSPGHEEIARILRATTKRPSKS
jgi:predicted short-subunit dehydrogenase-like oxidoreductase (DUF2520 family)